MKFLPILQKWGGEPFPEEGMVEGYWRLVGHPSTMLRPSTPPAASLRTGMVPLPTGFTGREERK
jgi:hypothetical protein